MTASDMLERLFDRLDGLIGDTDARVPGTLADQVIALERRHDELVSAIRSARGEYERAKLLGQIER